MKKILLSCVFSISISIFFFCQIAPTGTEGSIDLRVWIEQPSSVLQTRETTWDSLIVIVYADDMDTVRNAFRLNSELQFHSVFLENISAGLNRVVKMWTVDNEGDVIHGADSQTVSFVPSETVVVTITLDNPVKGSIYIEITDIPSNVDSVEFSFITAGTTWSVKDKKSTKLDLCIDKIPYGTTGTLSIRGYSLINDTVTFWIMEGFTFVKSNTTIHANFISVGTIGIEVTISWPGVTIIIGIMDITDSLGDETGGLLITEIMYSTNDSEYIEIYNPGAETFSDTIIIQKDNGTFRFYEVEILSNDFFVIGTKCLPRPSWFDTTASTASELNLTTTGNWITLRMASDSSIIDVVAFLAGSNDQGWPNFSSSENASIVLDSLADDPEYNNYGRNWVQAESFIDQSVTQQKGTPGLPGM